MEHVLVGREQICGHGVPREHFEGERTHESGGRFGHDHGHISPTLHQRAQ